MSINMSHIRKPGCNIFNKVKGYWRNIINFAPLNQKAPPYNKNSWLYVTC